MTNHNIMLWITYEIARSLPLVRAFEPVSIWDSEAKKFTDEQATKDGLLVWESQALMQTGWNADLTPVRVRIASTTQPKFQPNTEALVAMFSVQENKED